MGCGTHPTRGILEFWCACAFLLVSAVATATAVSDTLAPSEGVGVDGPGEPRGINADDIQVAQAPLQLGVPVAIPDLPQYATRCFVIRLPEAPRVRVLASVVGLAGIPTLRGGWVPVRPGYEASREAGFQTLAEELERTSPQYYVCARTFSAQGCDALLTVVVASSSELVPPPVWLRRDYPSVWPLGGDDAAPKSLRFIIQAEYLNDFHVSAVPVSGEADLEIFDAPVSSGPASVALDQDDCHGELLDKSSLIGPDIIDIPAHKQKHQVWGMETMHNLCIKVGGQGIVSLVAGPRIPGPFLAPFVPMAARFRAMAAGAEQVCEFFRLLVNKGTDMTVTAMAEDGSRLTLAASLTAELFQAPLGNRWKGEAPPGGTGAVLVVRHADVTRAAAEAQVQGGEVCSSVTVCRMPRLEPAGGSRQETTRFWVTAVTDRGVFTLEDGIPLAASVPQSKTQRVWRDFRFLVPAGAARPKEVTISATSSGQALVVADTARFPLKPGSYRWASNVNSSHAVLHLTTDPQLATRDVHLIDCRLPCFLYLSAHAFIDGATAGDADLQLLVASDKGTVKLLLDGQELEQTLAAGESQVFSYRLLRNDSAALFSLSTSEGVAGFAVSSLQSFPESPEQTTRQAADVILLEPLSQVFHSAVMLSKPGEMPSLFVRVRASAAAPCTFTVVARAEGDAKAMWNGDEVSGAVEARGYDRFRFLVGEHDVSQPVQVSIEVTPLTGQPAVFVACAPNKYPTEDHHDWGRHLQAQGSIVFTSGSLRFRPGWVYVAVTSRERAAYKVRVHWGNATVALQDGVEEIGHVMAGDTRPYVLAIGDNTPRGQPVAIRAEALVGAFTLCVADLPASGGAAHGNEACRHLASANASEQAELGLVALDIPAEEMHRVGRFLLLVRGIHIASDFALRVLAEAPALLAAEHSLVIDALGPPCCVVGPPAAQLLHRRYLHYSPPGVDRVVLAVRGLGFGSLKGATIKARQGSVQRATSGSWPVVAHADDDHGSSVLTQDVDLRILAGPNVQHGFWLEVGLVVEAPLNYTLHVGSSPGTLVQLSATRLLPNVLVAANLTTATPRKYEFDLGNGSGVGEWRLRVQECYGHLRIRLPYMALEAAHQGRGYTEVPLSMPKRQSDASSMGSAILEADGQLPVTYQVELVAPGMERALQLPKVDALIPSSGPGQNVSFRFGAASTSLLEQHRNASLRYTLVAVPQTDVLLNANTSCAIEEALRRGSTVSAQEELPSGGRGGHLSLVLPLADLAALNASVWVNVLVELLGPDGQRVAARSYSACSIGAAQLDAWAKPSRISAGVMPILVLLAGVGGFWGMINCMPGFCRGSPVTEPFEKDAVELEVQYDLHTDHQAGLYSQRSSYVPPSV